MKEKQKTLAEITNQRNHGEIFKQYTTLSYQRAKVTFSLGTSPGDWELSTWAESGLLHQAA